MTKCLIGVFTLYLINTYHDGHMEFNVFTLPWNQQVQYSHSNYHKRAYMMLEMVPTLCIQKLISGKEVKSIRFVAPMQIH